MHLAYDVLKGRSVKIFKSFESFNRVVTRYKILVTAAKQSFALAVQDVNAVFVVIGFTRKILVQLRHILIKAVIDDGYIPFRRLYLNVFRKSVQKEYIRFIIRNRLRKKADLLWLARKIIQLFKFSAAPLRRIIKPVRVHGNSPCARHVEIIQSFLLVHKGGKGFVRPRLFADKIIAVSVRATPMHADSVFNLKEELVRHRLHLLQTLRIKHFVYVIVVKIQKKSERHRN